MFRPASSWPIQRCSWLRPRQPLTARIESAQVLPSPTPQPRAVDKARDTVELFELDGTDVFSKIVGISQSLSEPVLACHPMRRASSCWRWQSTSADQRFLVLYTRATNPVLPESSWSATAVALGHWECDTLLSQPGATVGWAAAELRQLYALTPQQAVGVVNAARSAYCSGLAIPVTTLLSYQGQGG